MTTTATGCITSAEELLRTTLAACKTFQTWVGAASATEAAEHIYLEAVPFQDPHSDRTEQQELQSRRPLALIWTADSSGFLIDMIAAPRTPTPSGTLGLRLEDDIAAEVWHDYEEAARLFKNNVGMILHSNDLSNPGLVELNNVAGYLSWRSLRVLSFQRTTEDQQNCIGDAQAVEIEIDWGVVA